MLDSGTATHILTLFASTFPNPLKNDHPPIPTQGCHQVLLSWCAQQSRTTRMQFTSWQSLTIVGWRPTGNEGVNHQTCTNWLVIWCVKCWFIIVFVEVSGGSIYTWFEGLALQFWNNWLWLVTHFQSRRVDSNHAKERGNPVFRLPNVNLCCSVHIPFQLVELGSTRAASVVVLIYSSF